MSTEPEHVKSLHDRINEDYAPAWRPTAGDSVVGHVEEITIGHTDYGDYPIVTVITTDGRLAIHAFHSTLQGSLIDAEPSIGEEVAVRYSGLRLPKEYLNKDGSAKKDAPVEGSKDDPRYHDYKVIVNRAPVDMWAKLKQNREQKS